ncbi:hypothetical protein F503_04720 [Ophiostoma piceae UAMH 11346]|uniref:Uncharacterized protein n=1 Tax=Ophiostoma piceae (strain UAMH 11346) TaxID=1262450 RepID=S3CU56_OPHP1|nr:hypothetical protein F503_04720 [Ophiostoma piceae UAMH 11346]
MAEPYDINHPEFGKREEDWPDPDVDSDTEEGAAAKERAEAAMVATINRSVARRYQQTNTFSHIPKSLYIKARDHQDQLTADERQVLLGRGDAIGRVLAAPDSLTLEEMHMFLNWPSPDVVRANIQRHTSGQLSTPRELYAKAKDAIAQNQYETLLSPGAISLMAHSFREVGNPFSSESSTSDPDMLAIGPYLKIPGWSDAYGLLATRLGVVRRIQHRSMMHATQQMMVLRSQARGGTMEPGSGQNVEDIYDAMEALEQQRNLGTVSEEEFKTRQNEFGDAMARAFPFLRPTVPPPAPIPTMPIVIPTRNVPAAPPAFPPPSLEDSVGAGPWPPLSTMCSPFSLFRKDKQDRPREESTLGVWHQLTEEQKEVYRSRSEELRGEAWAEHERKVAASTEATGRYTGRRYEKREGYKASGSQELGYMPPSPSIVTGLMLFRDEVLLDSGAELRTETDSGTGAGPGMSREHFQLVSSKWDELPKQQKVAYSQRATQVNAENRAEHDLIMRAITPQQRQAAYLAWSERLKSANGAA